MSEARGKAHVHVVVVGFGTANPGRKQIFDYADDEKRPTITEVTNISPYLAAASDIVVTKRTTPLCEVPAIAFGNMPNDDGNLLLTTQERNSLVEKAPHAAAFIRPFLGSDEFINGIERWCIWLVNAPPAAIRGIPPLMERIEEVRKARLKSPRATTRALAQSPMLFGEIRQPTSRYLAIPKTSSERRRYIPIAFLPAAVIASTELQMIEGATKWHFGVLSSLMHMAWVKHVCGRLESRFRYSNQIVYNNFPWPPDVQPSAIQRVEEAAQRVIDARAQCGDGRHGYLPVKKKGAAASLADLYDPLTMPPPLAKAHAALDRAVDRCYRREPFQSDRQRVEHLFALYERLIAPLLPATPKRRQKK